uniref:Uncharacterized protein n=1 Tax=Rhizophora mucronata TaxID=61149 RepID=A0A2P2NNG8_RHIMU
MNLCHPFGLDPSKQ